MIVIFDLIFSIFTSICKEGTTTLILYMRKWRCHLKSFLEWMNEKITKWTNIEFSNKEQVIETWVIKLV